MGLNISQLKKLFKKATHAVKDEKDIPDARLAFSAILSSSAISKSVDIREAYSLDVPFDVIKGEMAVKDEASLYIHGGAFALGTKEDYRAIVSTLSDLLSMEMYIPQYRLLPEHSFSDMIDDIYSTYRFIKNKGYKKIFIIADGAGAYLTTILIKKITANSLPLPVKIAMISPFLDLKCSSLSLENKKKDCAFSPESLSFFASCVLKEKEDNNLIEEDLTCSEILSSFPPIFIQVSNAELLYNDSVRLKDSLLNKNKKVDMEVYEDAFHLFQSLPDISPLSYVACTSLAKHLKEV